jgi:hypothetical protein
MPSDSHTFAGSITYFDYDVLGFKLYTVGFELNLVDHGRTISAEDRHELHVADLMIIGELVKSTHGFVTLALQGVDVFLRPLRQFRNLLGCWFRSHTPASFVRLHLSLVYGRPGKASTTVLSQVRSLP